LGPYNETGKAENELIMLKIVKVMTRRDIAWSNGVSPETDEMDLASAYVLCPLTIVCSIFQRSPIEDVQSHGGTPK
jgi:hypothetical protein